MKTNYLLTGVIVIAIMLGSCTKEDTYVDPDLNAVYATSIINKFPNLSQGTTVNIDLGINEFSYYDNFSKVVEPSECGTTAFDEAIDETISENLDQLGAQFYSIYSDINFYMSLVDTSPQYFGVDGKYTNLMKKRVKDQERFWDMSNEVAVKGQHNANFKNEDLLRETLPFLYGPTADIDALIGEIYAINEESTFLIENPFVSFDGFAINIDNFFGKGQGDIIVISDGIVSVMTKTGIDANIIWTGILAHEWGHQIQFNNNWSYPVEDGNVPESTRSTELEADFFAAYYMTHKRGATYNWKRVEEFFDLFFNIGDCSFESDGHHGTPIQRMDAAHRGFELAQSAQKKGHILSPEAVHEIFIAQLPEIVE
ncbi:hypothetical protein [Galbibacter sp. PAP.153]|uniref:hypothetical protein n=1 Tax=Galbibacter sp. PAP.153 TaxID=3104623 RepID=UPI003009FE2D